MTLNVMTFNIQHGIDYKKKIGQIKEYCIDLDLMANVIKQLDADVCGLNEIYSICEGEVSAQTEKLGAKTNMNGIFGLAALIRGKKPYGNAVLSKSPIIKSEVTPIPVPNENQEPRSVLRCELANGLVVYQTHFGLSPEDVTLAADTVFSLFENEQKPAILMGDFNITPDNPVLLRLYNNPDITATDIFIKDKLSFPSIDPTKKIDYIFANKKVKVLNADIPDIVASDHRPVIACIEF